MMDARKYLEEVHAIRQRIQMKIRQVKSLRESLTDTALPIDKEQVSHTRNNGTIANTIAMIVDIEMEIEHQTIELLRTKMEAYALLDQNHPTSAMILIGYYLEGKGTDEIGKELCLLRRQAQRRLGFAIEGFKLVLDARQSAT